MLNTREELKQGMKNKQILQEEVSAARLDKEADWTCQLSHTGDDLGSRGHREGHIVNRKMRFLGQLNSAVIIFLDFEVKITDVEVPTSTMINCLLGMFDVVLFKLSHC